MPRRQGLLARECAIHTDESREAGLREEVRRLRAELDEARRAAMLDALTGCLNRRGWAERLRAEERRCSRHGLDAMVIVADLDGLKEINDSAGHDAGDRRLVDCGVALRRAVRAEDAVARLGGDEFAVLVVQTAGVTPEAVVARVEQALDEAGVEASLGWSLRSTHAGGLADAVTEADRRMLITKGGRRTAAE